MSQDFLEDSTKYQESRERALSAVVLPTKPAAGSLPAMLSASSLVFMILLMLGRTSGNSVSQTEGPVTLPEGEFLTLNCTYQTTYTTAEYLFWYVQYQNKEPVLLLKSSLDNQEVHNRSFQAKLGKTEKSFHLQGPSVQVSDSAVYFCALSDTVRESTGGAERKPRGAHPGLQGSSLAILGATGSFPGCSQETYRYLTGKWRLYFPDTNKNTCYGKCVY